MGKGRSAAGVSSLPALSPQQPTSQGRKGLGKSYDAHGWASEQRGNPAVTGLEKEMQIKVCWGWPLVSVIPKAMPLC